MTTNTFCKMLARVSLLLVALGMSAITFAQEKTESVNLTTNRSGSWYTAPWVWVVGAIVFVSLLIAMLRTGKRTGS